MAEQIINNGSSAGDPTAENIYTAFGKAKSNFAELYIAIGTFLLKAGGTMTGVLQFAVGSASAPSAKIGSDQKGFYHEGTDKLGVSVAGAKVGEFNSNGYAGLVNRIVLQDRKAANTAPQSAAAATDNIRNINTAILNNITGASLGTNEFTLPVGRYYIKDIKASTGTNIIQFLKLYNLTGSVLQTDINSNQIVGMSCYTASDYSFISLSGYYFDVTGSSKTFQVLHYTLNSGALGGAANKGVDEIYLTIEIEKVG